MPLLLSVLIACLLSSFWLVGFGVHHCAHTYLLCILVDWVGWLVWFGLVLISNISAGPIHPLTLAAHTPQHSSLASHNCHLSPASVIYIHN